MASKPQADQTEQPQSTFTASPLANRPFVVEPDQQVWEKPIVTTGETLTVGCKLPHGIMLQLFQFEEVTEPVMGGGVRQSQIARPIAGYEPVKLNGFANYLNQPAQKLTYGGFGMTYGVPKDIFNQWMKDNKDSEIVKKGLVFAIEGEPSGAQLEGQNRKELKSGLEPLDPTKKIKVGPATVEEESDRPNNRSVT